MLLTQKPRLLLLDEPVAGMTRRERDRTGELLQAIGDDCAVLVVEHDMVFVRQFASNVTVLHMGQLLCEGPVETVQSDPQVIEVYLGRGHQKSA
jgi:urea transport system ATP-binding protein